MKNYSDIFPTCLTRDLCFEGESVGGRERNILLMVALDPPGKVRQYPCMD